MSSIPEQAGVTSVSAIGGYAKPTGYPETEHDSAAYADYSETTDYAAYEEYDQGDDFPTKRQRAMAWTRRYGWLVASGALALIVLLFVLGQTGEPDPAWQAATSTSAAPPPTTAAPATSPAPATTRPTRSPTASPTPSSRATKSPSARPRKTTPPARPTTRSPSKPTAAPPPPPPAPKPVLVGPDGDWELWFMLRRYCAQDGREPQLRSGNVSPAEGNWECRRRGSGVLIDMSAACRYAYGPGTFANYTDRNNALSWRCYRQG